MGIKQKNIMLLDIVKQIVAKNGEQILLDPKRITAFLGDLAKDEPKLQKLAFIECLEHGVVNALKNVASPERTNCKEALAQKLHLEEGLDVKLYRNAMDILCEILFGEKYYVELQNKDNNEPQIVYSTMWEGLKKQNWDAQKKIWIIYISTTLILIAIIAGFTFLTVSVWNPFWGSLSFWKKTLVCCGLGLIGAVITGIADALVEREKNKI
jgi:hypothetical protein